MIDPYDPFDESPVPQDEGDVADAAYDAARSAKLCALPTQDEVRASVERYCRRFHLVSLKKMTILCHGVVCEAELVGPGAWRCGLYKNIDKTMLLDTVEWES